MTYPVHLLKYVMVDKCEGIGFGLISVVWESNCHARCYPKMESACARRNSAKSVSSHIVLGKMFSCMEKRYVMR